MAGLPPPGWHPDPRGRHEHRYWDGVQWTDHVADGGQISTDPLNPPPVVPAEREPEPEQQRTAPAATARREPLWEARAEGPMTSLWARPQPDAEVQPAEPPPEPEASPEVEPEPEPAAGGPSPGLATLLSVVAPGAGHLHLGVDDRRRTTAVGLLIATAVAVGLAYLSFGLWVIGLLIWLTAAGYALTDLGPSAAPLHDLRLDRRRAGTALAVAGAALAASPLLPWYHVSIDARGIAAAGGSISGFEATGATDLVLVVVGAAGVLAGLTALGHGPLRAARLSRAAVAVAVGAALAVVLVAYRMLVDPVPGFGVSGPVDLRVGRAPGLLLAGAASLALLLAAVSALRSSGDRTPAA